MAGLCPECGSGEIETADGEHRCRECGLVLQEDVVDPGPEWRGFETEACPELTRAGSPNTPTRHDGGIGTNRQDGSELTVAYDTRRLRWDSKKERNLAHGLGTVRRVCSCLDAGGSLTERACELFQEAHTADTCEGRSIEHVSAATVLVAVREAGIPVRLGDISEHIQINESNCRFWPVYHKVVDATSGSPGVRTPGEFVGRLCDDLDLTLGTRRRVADRCRVAEREAVAGGAKPIGITAAAVYLEAPHLSQREVAEEAGISRPTVRDRTQDLREVADGE